MAISRFIQPCNEHQVISGDTGEGDATVIIGLPAMVLELIAPPLPYARTILNFS